MVLLLLTTSMILLMEEESGYGWWLGFQFESIRSIFVLLNPYMMFVLLAHHEKDTSPKTKLKIKGHVDKYKKYNENYTVA